MSQSYQGGPVAIFAVGFSAVTSGTSARTAIPVDSAGNKARYIRVAAINETYVKLGDSGVTATNNDVLVQPADCALMMVSGATHIAYIQGASAGRVSVAPLENC